MLIVYYLSQLRSVVHATINHSSFANIKSSYFLFLTIILSVDIKLEFFAIYLGALTSIVTFIDKWCRTRGRYRSRYTD